MKNCAYCMFSSQVKYYIPHGDFLGYCKKDKSWVDIHCADWCKRYKRLKFALKTNRAQLLAKAHGRKG